MRTDSEPLRGHPRVRLALVQMSARKGRVGQNLEAVATHLRALAGEVDLVLFPEAITSGYFVERGVAEVARTPRWIADQLAERAPDFRGWVALGFYERGDDALHNSAMLLRLGEERVPPFVHRKVFLPTYGVFDEKRFVSPGRRLDVAGTEIGRIGLLVCEDAWHSACATALALKGAQMILIPSASPGRGFAGERPHSVDSWRALMRAIALEHGVWVGLANLTGFEGSRGFPGGSLVVSPEGDIVAELGDRDDVLRCDVDLAEVSRVRTTSPLLSDLRGTLDVILRAIEEGRS